MMYLSIPFRHLIGCLVVALCWISQSKTNAQQSQIELLKGFNNTPLNVFKVVSPKYNRYKFEKAKKPWDVKIEKDGDLISKLIVVRAGVIEEEYTPDLKEYPAFFKDIRHRVLCLDDYFYYIKWSGGKATIKYVLTTKADVSGDVESHIAKIEKYIPKTVAAQKGDRAKLAEKKAEVEAAEAVANSLKGKKLKSIAIKWGELPNEFGHMSKIPYGIEATLTSGKVLKTKNIGGKTSWDDFKITVKGAEFGEELLTIAKDASKIPTDNIIVNVTSKYHPAIKASKKLAIPYSSGIYINHNGERGGVVNINIYPGYRGGDATNLNVYVKAATTANGTKVNKIEVRNAQTSKVLHRMKMQPNAPLTINLYGGSGSFGTGSKNGGNGGDGGNVSIIKDPNVGGFTYTVNNSGGSGGKHDQSRYKNGSAGRDGNTSVRTGAVNISW